MHVMFINLIKSASLDAAAHLISARPSTSLGPDVAN
jgi:hypothetical protein